MDNNDAVGLDDNETAGLEDEKVVTMMDVLKEQEDFEEDANAVLGASDDKNCTFSMGYIKRQAIYACMTCNSDAKDDPSKRAGVCLACSLKCHEDHELVELYTKRNFRCDCGNPKFKSHPCQFTPNKQDLNEENSYNQNFSGLYCICQRPYPDPDVTEEDEMIQCIICEDWLHSAHLDATVPDNDQYSEMICKQCMEKNNFLHNYGDLIVNSEADVIDISMNGLSNSGANESVIMDTTNDLSINNIENLQESITSHSKDTFVSEVVDVTVKNDEIEINTLTKEKDYVNKSEHIATNKSNDSMKASQTQTSLDNNVMTSEKNCLSSEHTPNVEKEQVTFVNNLQNKNITDITESNIEPSELLDITEHEKSVRNSTASNENEAMQNSKLNFNESTILRTDTVQEMESDSEIGNLHKNASVEQINAKGELLVTETIEFSKEKLINYNEEGNEKVTSTKSPDDLEEDRLLEDPVPENNATQVKSVTPENNATQVNSVTDEIKTEDLTTVPVTENNVETLPEKDTACGTEPQLKESSSNANSGDKTAAIDNNAEELPLDNLHKNQHIICEKMDVTNDTELSNTQEPMEKSQKNECKRKLSKSVEDQVDDLEYKKPKLDSKPCVKPQNVKQRYQGATFWPVHFRQKLCTCNECLSMYKDLSVLFLIDPEDTVSAYEHLGKEKSNGKPASEYEKGLAALSSLDRVQQINALTEYNKMRDKLLDFLKSFKDRKEVVKEEDIKAFFAGMKPKREPDGVYFCR
ncbi:putative E3 ubiquitin-protein ligase UBR7 isoform X1 [Pieris napi]|uniref:putative E3 ubiquitin-protein ligase UBR7 isoform X1 n=1 Tax=Pieris napi TaxID=78633 RepID=UPI001FBA31B3|nr:putative E3 ubiquitin-protein ligase UBR7 isoform X1 [Pieris napi]